MPNPITMLNTARYFNASSAVFSFSTFTTDSP